MFLSSTKEDFSKRDETIRVNSYTTVTKRTGVPFDVYDNYWRDVHGPLCARLPGLGWYVQHHFAPEHADHLWPLPEGVVPFKDYALSGMVEIGFASEADQALFVKASPLLFSDEQNIFDESVAYSLPRGSKTFVDRQEDPVPNGPAAFDLLHLHFHSAQDDPEDFGAYMNSFAKALVGFDGVMKVRLHLPEPHDNSKADPPAPDVKHSVPSARVLLSVLEIGFRDPLTRHKCIASPAFVKLHEGQGKHVSKLAAFKVSGVYTYIRDGELTTAGLRGSRAAELITALGAINQVQPDVVKIMKTGKL